MPQPLLSAERVQARIDELAADLNRDFAQKDPLIVCILKGSYIFTADLSRRLTIPHEIDFMATSSYADGTTSSGEVQLTKDLSYEISGRHVLLVEDIVDTGNTLRFLIETLQKREPESISIITLLKKKGVDEANLPNVDYVGFTVPPVFVVGYGLDYAEQYRHLPYVAVLSGVPEPGREAEGEPTDQPTEK
jgi:hypoxanthine phosphoribosyltransferase